jgi:penicillin V acylase-like amidase (Ntn superfamily)
MKNIFLILLSLGLVYSAKTVACSSALLSCNNEAIVVKSYDFDSGSGRLFFYPAGLTKTVFHPMAPKQPFQWKSKYKSLGFSQIGAQFTFGGINEAGLSVEILWLNTASYPAADGQKPLLNESHIIQYLLDNAEDVGAVSNLLKSVDISPILARVHYYICDATKNCVVVYGQKNQLIVQNAKEAKSLANDSYEDSLQRYLSDKSDNSRFGKLARASNQINYKGNPFDLLDSVAQGAFTKWQIVYNLNQKKLSWRTDLQSDIQSVNLTALNSKCQTFNLSWDVNTKYNSKDLDLAQTDVWSLLLAQKYLQEFPLSSQVPDDKKQAFIGQQFFGLSCN